jgi:hypothetical protein
VEQQHDNLDKPPNSREGNERHQQQQQQNVNTLATKNDSITTAVVGKYTTPHATLRALRRYPLDCDGTTGLPYTLLVDYDNDASSNNNEEMAVNEVIRKIDAFASSSTYWDYGYDSIIEAVRRNRDRIDYSRVLIHANNNNTLTSSATAFDDDTGINDDEEEEEEEEEGTIMGKKKRKRGRRSTVVRFKDDDDDNSNEDVVARQGDVKIRDQY